MYGTQTMNFVIHNNRLFENDVKMYGTQTKKLKRSTPPLFENDVNKKYFR